MMDDAIRGGILRKKIFRRNIQDVLGTSVKGTPDTHSYIMLLSTSVDRPVIQMSGGSS